MNSRSNPYQPSPRQGHRSSPSGRRVKKTRDRKTCPPNHRVPVQCRLRFQRRLPPGCRCGTQTPIEARASRGEARGSCDPRGLETHSGPRTGLLMTSDVAGARPLSPGSGEERRIPCTRLRHEEESGCPIKRACCRTLAHDRDAQRVRRHLQSVRSQRARSPWLELGVWLTRSLPRYAVRNFSIENTVRRDTM